MKGHQAVRLAEEVETLGERATLITLYVHCLSCSFWPQPTFNRYHIIRHEEVVNLAHLDKAVVTTPALLTTPVITAYENYFHLWSTFFLTPLLLA